jgi:hypothetical protein
MGRGGVIFLYPNIICIYLGKAFQVSRLIICFFFYNYYKLMRIFYKRKESSSKIRCMVWRVTTKSCLIAHPVAHSKSLML